MLRESIHQWRRQGLRLSRLCAAALALGAAAASAQDVGVTATEILLGEVQPMSGPASLIGKAGAAGSKLAIAEINAKGGINGRKLRAIYEDDGYVPARSVSAVTKLIDSDKVFALTGTSGRVPVSTYPGPGDNSAIVDLKAVGVRAIGDALQFAADEEGLDTYRDRLERGWELSRVRTDIGSSYEAQSRRRSLTS